MTTEVIIAGMSLLGTLAGSFAGINNLIERTFRLEQECAELEERVRAADRRIDGLEEEQA